MKTSTLSRLAATLMVTACACAAGAAQAQNPTGNPGSAVPNDQTNYPNKATPTQSAMKKSQMNSSTSEDKTMPPGTRDPANEMSKPPTKGPNASKGPN